MVTGGPYGVGTDNPAEARRRLMSQNTKAELMKKARKILGAKQVNRMADRGASKEVFAQSIVEARGLKSRGGSPDWAGAPDWNLERDI